MDVLFYCCKTDFDFIELIISGLPFHYYPQRRSFFYPFKYLLPYSYKILHKIQQLND